MGGTLFFSVNDGTHGVELWRSDGTAGGTQMVDDIYPGSGSSLPQYLTNVDGTLFFSADDGTHGFELWRSDGTAGGTQMVDDINPGSANSYPGYLTNVDGTLFFAANDGTHGDELWRSDGTAGGTQMVDDINPGSASSYPKYLTNADGTLFFSANDGTHGVEPWILLPASSAVSWTGAAGDLNWDNPNNWSPTGVPTSADDVTISIAVPGAINISGGAYAVGSLNDTTAPLTIAPGASLSLAAGVANSTFGQSVTVSAGGTLAVGAEANVQVKGNVTFTDNGTMTFGSGDTVNCANNGNPIDIVVGAGALLTASGVDFFNSGSFFNSQLSVAAGGHLQTSNCTFALSGLTLENGSILNSGDLIGNRFDLPLSLPYGEVADLSGTGSNNQSFQDINILSGTLASGQTLTLNAIGTASTANLAYVFPGNFTVATGAKLSVADNLVVVLQSGVILTDNGTLAFASTTQVILTGDASTQQIVVGNGGLLTATSSTFKATGLENTGLIIVNAGGHLVASNSTFASSLNQVDLNSGSILNAGDLSGNSFKCPLIFSGGTVTGAFTNTGTINGDGQFNGAFTNAGTLEPGDAPGRIKNIGPYMQTAQGNLAIQTAGTAPTTQYSQLEVDGPQISLGGSLQLDQANGFFPSIGDTFTVLQNDMNMPITGTFNGLTEGSTLTEKMWRTENQDGSFNTYSVQFKVSYQGGTGGHNVVLTDATAPPTHVAVDNASVPALVGTTAFNTGTWSDASPSATVTLSASVGTITQSAMTGSGTWSWSDNTTGLGAGPVAVTITESDGSSNIIVPFTLNVQDATTTTVTASPAPSVFGQAVTFTAAVKPSHSGSAFSPTGRVDFTNGSSDLTPGGVTVSGGTATFTTSALSVGSHTISAAYSGDANFQLSSGSDSSAPQVVKQAKTATANVISSADPSVHGQTVTFLVTVSAVAPGTGVPTGTVTFRYEGGTLGSGTLDGGGLATFTTSTLSTSVHTITASYGGDSNFSGSNDTASPKRLVQRVNKAKTATANVTSSVKASVHGQKVTFSVRVSAVVLGAGVPTGTVVFRDQHGSLGSATLNGSGLATFTTSTLSTSVHTVTASYDGDSNFSGSNDTSSTTPLVQTVSKAKTTTADVASSVNPSVHGQKVTFSVKVSAVAPGAGIPTGTVTFSDQSGRLGSGTLNGNGLATFATSTLSTSVHTITASYGGDGNFLGSTRTFNQAVGKDGVHIGLNASVNPSAVGQSITLLASASALRTGSGVPTGTVTFTDLFGGKSKSLGKATLNAFGVARLAVGALAAGNHTITAVYSGDNNFKPQNSAADTEVVQQGALVTSLLSSSAASAFGQTITFTATEKLSSGAAASGTVTFQNGATKLATVTLNSAGRATFATGSLAVGNHTIVVVYRRPNATTPSNMLALIQSVAKAGTTTTVSSSLASTSFGQLVTFTAVVKVVSPGAGTLAGNVIFKNGAVTLGSASLKLVSGKDVAIFVTKTLAIGSHTISAVYQGNGNFLSSTAAGILETVKKDGSAVRIAGSPPPPSVLHQTVTFTAAVQAAAPGSGTPTGTVVFKDSFISGGVTMSSALATVALGAGKATFSTSSLAVGNHVITAVYGGSADFAGATSVGYPQGVRASSGAATDAGSSSFKSSVPAVIQETLNSSAASAAVPQELSVLSVDQLFSSAATTHNTPRMLAGALIKAHSSDDWLTGPF